MEKIEIKLKECCLSCEHFDASGIRGFSPFPLSCCGEPERVIACGHMEVCYKYMNHKQVVICKDCQYWKPKKEIAYVDRITAKKISFGVCGLFDTVHEENNFCSHGICATIESDPSK